MRRVRASGTLAAQMKGQDRRSVASVIEANTERVTVDELAKRGTRHVRIISGAKTLELIEAVVDRAIALRAGEVAARDRDRIVEEANEQFQRVSRIQAEAENLLEQQRETIARQGKEIAEIRDRLRRAAASLKKRERRLENARATIVNYDAEIDKLAAQVKLDADVIGELKHALAATREMARQPAAPDLGAIRDELARLFAERDEKSSAQIEKRFSANMDQALDKISRTLKAATSRPIDSRIEATDALVARLFENEDEDMESNLGALDITVSTAQDGIAKSLERLKRLRGAPVDDEEGAEDQAPA